MHVPTLPTAWAFATGLVPAGVVLVLPLSGAAQGVIVASVSGVVSVWAFFGPAAHEDG